MVSEHNDAINNGDTQTSHANLYYLEIQNGGTY